MDYIDTYEKNKNNFISLKGGDRKNSIIVHNKLTELIPLLPTPVIEGIYKEFSFVLIGGSSYKSSYFNKFVVSTDNKFYRKFNYETEYPYINFQKRLSKITQTISFDRPTDLLNHNLYSNGHNEHIYVASKKDLTMKNYAKFMKKTLDYYKIRQPYVFIGASEGGYDILCFSKYYENLIKKIYFIDTPLLGKYMLEFEKYRGNDKWYENLNKNILSWNGDFGDMGNDVLQKIDVYNFEIKTINVLMKLNLKSLQLNVPMTIFWSPYLDSQKINKKKVKIINKMNKKLKKNICINTIFMDAPHQMERVIPITLSQFIIDTVDLKNDNC